MHAFAELEHDLVYKEHGGTVSDEERDLLDQLKDVVTEGDKITAQLPSATERRLRGPEGAFLTAQEAIDHIRTTTRHELPDWLDDTIRQAFPHQGDHRWTPDTITQAFTDPSTKQILTQPTGDDLAHHLLGPAGSMDYDNRNPVYPAGPSWHRADNGRWQSVHHGVVEARDRYRNLIKDHPTATDPGLVQELDAAYREAATDATDGNFHPRQSNYLGSLETQVQCLIERHNEGTTSD